ncbi:glycine cleavage system protein R [Pseudomonas sp. nanlin1]|uniref:glycine cleavage system protein R n=1 Tax=Pseudomonas sp. nanlin1 TaxID=3040605 RepID=UPI00388DD931
MDDLVLTVIAADKPGVVERIAQCIAIHEGNWLESRMARMAGQFAGILRVAVPADSAEALKAALQALSEQGIRVLVAQSGQGQAAEARTIVMKLVGNDRPGIVRDITRVLAEQGVNVEGLSTDVLPAPMSSESLFHADATLAVPVGLTLEALQTSLETLADDLIVELSSPEPAV